MSVLTLPNGPALSLTVRAKALVFEDPRSRDLLARIHQVAPSDATILLIGETGTGKEIVARHVHQLSRRADQPFVAVNCGAFSETLVESELFGHERGAFTGAITTKKGWFEAAHGGTLFLDEIGDLPAAVQVKLLRVLQEHEVVRVGSRQPIATDVRLIAATNVNLESAVAAGRFREDLYYRLAVARLEIAPLRSRPGDILPLANHFVRLFAQRLGVGPVELGPAAAQRLLEHTWPGNIRELENVIHQCVLLSQGPELRADDLRISTPLVRGVAPAEPGLAGAASTAAGTGAEVTAALARALEALYDRNEPALHDLIEATVIRTAYRYCHRNQLQTARLLGISRNVVRARLIQAGELAGPLRAEHPRTAA